MSTQPYHHGDLKTQLIREGLKLLDRDGYDGFSLRKVAALCGVSQTAPYRHFKNKEDLITSITNYALEAFGKRLQDAVDMHPDQPVAQLSEMGVAYVRFFAENPGHLRLLFLSDVRLRLRFAQDETHHHYQSSFGVLHDTVTGLKNAYPGIPFSQDELVLQSWGLVHGIATLIATGELPDTEETLALAERVIRGACQMGGAPPRRE